MEITASQAASALAMARSKKLSPERRREIAIKANHSRKAFKTKAEGKRSKKAAA